jgi:hypothetical protein
MSTTNCRICADRRAVTPQLREHRTATRVSVAHGLHVLWKWADGLAGSVDEPRHQTALGALQETQTPGCGFSDREVDKCYATSRNC